MPSWRSDHACSSRRVIACRRKESCHESPWRCSNWAIAAASAVPLIRLLAPPIETNQLARRTACAAVVIGLADGASRAAESGAIRREPVPLAHDDRLWTSGLGGVVACARPHTGGSAWSRPRLAPFGAMVVLSRRYRVGRRRPDSPPLCEKNADHLSGHGPAPPALIAAARGGRSVVDRLSDAPGARSGSTYDVPVLVRDGAAGNFSAVG